MKPLQIGNVTLENNLILAPMAGVTDLPFRILCKEQGAGLICMEMVSAKAILYRNKNTEELLNIDEKERPVSLQLFGSDPDIISEIAKQIEERHFDILDINTLASNFFIDCLSSGVMVVCFCFSAVRFTTFQCKFNYLC